MPEAFIVDAMRTPVGRRGGGLAAAHPADLGAHVITALLARTQVDPLAVDDVVFGCVDTVGPQAGDIARTTLVHALERTGGRYGLVTMCEGGGQANVTIVERL
jgi:acetyl-CoA C-acetyltransferase